MNWGNRRRFQLIVAIVIFFSATYLTWQVDTARIAQHRYLEGCWPEYVDVSGQNVLTVDFWMDNVKNLDLGPIDTFFHTRVRHRILFYMLVIGSLIGWSGSIFLKTMNSEENATNGSRKKTPSWEFVTSSLFLALLSGAILFLLLVSGRLVIDPQGQACINEGYAYFALIGAFASGLFVVQFFDWLKGSASGLWNNIVK